MGKSRNFILVLVLVLATAASVALGKYWLGPGPFADKSAGAGSSISASGKQSLTWFGYVDLRHGTAGLNPLRPGRVTKVLVRENDDVSPGAPLVQLDDGLAQLQVQEAEAALKLAEKRLAKARRLPAQFQAKIAQQQDAIQAAAHRLEAAKHMLALKQKLQDKSLISSQELGVAESQAKEAEAVLRAERQKLVGLKLEDPNLEIDLAQAEVERLKVKEAQAKKDVEEFALKAPEAGTVMQVHVQPGDVLGIAQRQPAIIFAPRGARIIRAEIEQEFAGKFRLDMPVRVEDDTNVEILCTGKITYLSDWFLPRRFQRQDPTLFNSNRTLECFISLEPGHPPLRIGQRVRIRLQP